MLDILLSYFAAMFIFVVVTLAISNVGRDYIFFVDTVNDDAFRLQLLDTHVDFSHFGQ